jgi:hypothetical protein
MRHAAVVRAGPAVMLRKANAAVTTFRGALLVLLPAGWRVYEVPRRIDVVIVVAGVGECFAALSGEADDQGRCEKGLHLVSLGIRYRRSDRLRSKDEGRSPRIG